MKLKTWFSDFQHSHRLALLSLLVGFLSGLIAVILKKTASGFHLIIDHFKTFSEHDYWIAFLPFLGLILVRLLLVKVFKFRPGAGIPVVLRSISKQRSNLDRRQILTSFFGSAVTVGMGGSAGLEGPTVQSASALANLVSKKWKPDYKTRTMLLACASAGSMAAIFHAPVAAIVFAVEVIMIDLTATSLFPLLLASITAFMTAHVFDGDQRLLQSSLRFGFEVGHLHHYIALGILSGFGASYFSRIYLGVLKFVGRLNTSRKQILISGTILTLIILFIPNLFGEGYPFINELLKDSTRSLNENELWAWMLDNPLGILFVLITLLLLKVVATGLTNGGGGIGGVFAPSLFMGATLGMLYSRIWKLFPESTTPTGNLVLVGMAGLVAGVLHAPLTGMFLIAELTGGYSLLVPLMITTGISFYISKRLNKHNLYTQELAQKGELITHNKDQAVLTLMNLKDEIETNFSVVKPEMSLGDLVQVIAQSNRNLFPVLTNDGALTGIITLDELRPYMFQTEKYEQLFAKDFMETPAEIIELNEHMESVMKKFDESQAWNLPVVDQGKYLGFVSKSKLFSAYRHYLQQTNLT